MGCDIHIFVQIFDEKTQKWLLVRNDQEHGASTDESLPVFPEGKEEDDDAVEQYGNEQSKYEFGLPRDYIFFAKIADVRNEYGLLNVLEPKGFPEDLTLAVKKFINYEGYGHTPTYLYDEDIRKIDAWEWPVCESTTYLHVLDYIQLRKKHPNSSEEYLSICSGEVKTHECANGFIYTAREWDLMDPSLQKLELSRRPAYGEKRNCVYVKLSYTRPSRVDSRAYPEFMKLVRNIREWYPDQRYRLLVYFDS